MKRTIALAFFVTLAVAAFGQEEDSEDAADQPPPPPRVQLYAGFSFGALVGGYQYDVLNEGLTPQPDTIDYLAPTVGLRVFPSRWLGVEVGSDPVSLVYAVKNNTGTTNSTTTRPLLCYNYNNYFGGLAFRYFVENILLSNLSLVASLGANYNIFAYNGDFMSLVPSNFSLYSVSPGLGWYGSVGAEVTVSRRFFLGGRLAYYHLHNRIEQSNHDYDGELLKLTGYMGIAF